MQFEVESEKISEHVSRTKKYAMIVLERGPDYETTQDVMPAHATFWIRRKEEGRVLMNGPVLGDEDIVGMGVFNTDDIGEVKGMMDKDPGVITGRFRYRSMTLVGMPGDALK
jgi:uncharacterized protein YciI